MVSNAGYPQGVLLHNRYRVINQIGTGGFGVVYKAVDTQHTDRLVAIKAINLSGLRPQAVIEATDAFKREVLLLSHLSHSNLPCIYDHRTTPENCYLVMEFIKGETIEQCMSKAQEGRLPLSEVLDIGIQLCTVLDYLHSQQPPVIFRDLKPSNIMRTPRGHIYLIDFGIARHFKPGQAKDTAALGSPGYAAPEQYGRAQTTPRSDIYSLGALLHHLLTTHDPTETPFHFIPLWPNSHLAIVELGMLVMQMVERDANQRPGSMNIIKQELQRIAHVWKALNMHFWRPGPQHTSLGQARHSRM
jgi:eukaryotic-like serine/threonine-protein kinase